VSEIDGNVMKCVKEKNGKNVVKKCIECVENNELKLIINEFYGKVFYL
jgi:hypothetical protein